MRKSKRYNKSSNREGIGRTWLSGIVLSNGVWSRDAEGEEEKVFPIVQISASMPSADTGHHWALFAYVTTRGEGMPEEWFEHIPDREKQPELFRRALELRYHNMEDPPFGRVCCAHVWGQRVPSKAPLLCKFKDAFALRLRDIMLKTVWKQEIELRNY
jgi:hypothetical protein